MEKLDICGETNDTINFLFYGTAAMVVAGAIYGYKKKKIVGAALGAVVGFYIPGLFLRFACPIKKLTAEQEALMRQIEARQNATIQQMQARQAATMRGK
jgi:hypothetical protein